MKKFIKKLFFPVIGMASLLWFLIRVIPKPSRVAYPCMKATAPVASTFVVYLLGLLSSLVIFKRAKKYLYESRYVLFSVSLFIGAVLALSTYLQTDSKAYGDYQSVLEGPNQPMGIGKGNHPGQVVWIHNPNATNEHVNPESKTNYWSLDVNTNQDTLNAMLSQALKGITGAASDTAAWDSIFRYYNRTHNRGNEGYSSGERIVIKINLNGYANWYTWGNAAVNTSPQLVYAVLNQLVNVAGVAQADIGVGDPNQTNRSFPDIFWNKCHGTFPDVEYWGDDTNKGETPIVRSADFVLHTSDGDTNLYIPQCYLDATYMINLPVLKKHHRAGISICAKNHFGTIGPFHGGAWSLHYSLPCGGQNGCVITNPDYGIYRCFVDIMGHKDLGGKTIIYIVDGLWSSTNWGHPAIKWRMTPFNNDFPSSLFISQDPVAIESVCFDFLYHEFDPEHPTEGPINPADDNKGAFPYFPATDDYLHQAADSTNWPAGIFYDPEQDGTNLPFSLGVHEHWNNATDKQYSRNLGENEGIELVYVGPSTTPTSTTDKGSDLMVNDFALQQNYPNPFNATTTIWYKLAHSARVRLVIYNALGQKIRTVVDNYQAAGPHVQRWDGRADNGITVATGVYFYELTAHNGSQSVRQIKKMIFSK
jgi:hypothetical protein